MVPCKPQFSSYPLKRLAQINGHTTTPMNEALTYFIAQSFLKIFIGSC